MLLKVSRVNGHLSRKRSRSVCERRNAAFGKTNTHDATLTIRKPESGANLRGILQVELRLKKLYRRTGVGMVTRAMTTVARVWNARRGGQPINQSGNRMITLNSRLTETAIPQRGAIHPFQTVTSQLNTSYFLISL